MALDAQRQAGCPHVAATLTDLPKGVTEHRPSTASGSDFDAALAVQKIRDAAQDLGIVALGFVEASRLVDAGARLEHWLAQGYQGEMQYLVAGGRDDPTLLLPGARTLIAAAFPYRSPSQPAANELNDAETAHDTLRGSVASYALGADYHNVLKLKLRLLADACAEASGQTLLARACVDTAPLLEREVARRAGLGFIGKSSMLIVPGLGSYVLLGVLLLDLALPEAKHEFRRPAPAHAFPVSAQEPRRARLNELDCGNCRACLDACPTSAFAADYVLDARRCVSYLTIELQGAVPSALRAGIGEHVFGCDVCQSVCPYNASTKPKPETFELREVSGRRAPRLGQLLNLSASGYRRFVEHSALRRVSRARLMRNAAIALGNSRDSAALPLLARAVVEHSTALVRQHVAWALGELATQCPNERGSALSALGAAVNDPDEQVRVEVANALERLAHP